MSSVSGNKIYIPYTSKRKVDIGKYKVLCVFTCNHILKISTMLTPNGSTFCQLYIPFWLILIVGSRFKIMIRAWVNSQEGLQENCDKFLRFYRRNLAWKINQQATHVFSAFRSTDFGNLGPPKATSSRYTLGHFTISCP